MQQIQFKNFFETNTQKEIRTIELTISYNEFIYKLYNEFTLHLTHAFPVHPFSSPENIKKSWHSFNS